MSERNNEFWGEFFRENAAVFLKRETLEPRELLAFRPWLFRLVDLFIICAVAAMLLFTWGGLLLVPLPVALALPAFHAALTLWMRRRQPGEKGVRDEFLLIMLLCTAWVLAYVFVVAEPLGTLVAMCNLTFIAFSMIGVAPWAGLLIYAVSMASLYSIRLLQIAIDWPARLADYPVNLVTAGGVGWLYLVLFITSAFITNLVWQQKSRHFAALYSLEDANTKLRAAERARKEFLSAVTHELRTPLVAIHGYADLLLQNQGDKDSVLTIKRSATRLQRLIEELLDTAAPLNLTSRMRLEPVALNEILNEEFTALQAHADAQEITLSIEKTSPCTTFADRMRMGQVIANLLDNALKHSSPGATIRAGTSVHADSGKCTLWIEDTGAGIAAESLTHIFEPFYSSQPLHTTPSMGLGLSICRQIVTALGGSITVDSDPGKGSRFTIVLPMYHQNSAVPGTLPSTGRRALVLDDEIDVLNLMREALANFGFSVDIARNGTMALELALKHTYDLHLLDVNVPGLTGIEVSRRLREAGKPGKTLLFSALIRHDADQIITEAQADGFMPKPFTFDGLELVLKQSGLWSNVSLT